MGDLFKYKTIIKEFNDKAILTILFPNVNEDLFEDNMSKIIVKSLVIGFLSIITFISIMFLSHQFSTYSSNPSLDIPNFIKHIFVTLLSISNILETIFNPLQAIYLGVLNLLILLRSVITLINPTEKNVASTMGVLLLSFITVIILYFFEWLLKKKVNTIGDNINVIILTLGIIIISIFFLFIIPIEKEND